MGSRRRGLGEAAASFLLLCALHVFFRGVHAAISPAEVNALQKLSAAWNGQSVLGWNPGTDICSSWPGVVCSPDGMQVVQLSLQKANVSGSLPSDIGGLSNLQALELTFMEGLGGPLPAGLGQLVNLVTLNLQGCSFSGSIPSELGQLLNLKFLALNNNQLSGEIPDVVGKLSQVYWFDVSQNRLSGPIPVSSQSGVGLDNLTNILHLHLNNNSLSGVIPVEICSLPNLIHLLLDANLFGGTIPSAIGNFQSLILLRLQINNFIGPVPAEISKISTLNEIHLNDNSFNGTLPDFSALKNLALLDVSNNKFSTQPFPPFVQFLVNLETFSANNASLVGPLPASVFNLQKLGALELSNNGLNGTLAFGSSASQSLQIVLLDNNQISAVAFPIPAVSFQEFSLQYNPVCTNAQANSLPSGWCLPANAKPYVQSAPRCGAKSCQGTKSLNPSNCGCYYPLSVTIQLTSPTYKTINDSQVQKFELLLQSSTKTQVFVSSGMLVANNRITMETNFFGSDGKDLDYDIALAIVTNLTNQLVNLPGFAPYLVVPYPLFPPRIIVAKGSSLGAGAVVGIVVAALLVGLILVAVAMYAIRQKTRADKAESKPFASWPGSGGGDNGAAPKLKGARWFSFAELKKATDGFSEQNEIGAGGYGKVYKGVLDTREVVAVKRAQEGSMQGASEFKNEIELLSRVHHKNLVGLVGFCYEQKEQMLVYEFMANGTLRDHLVGKAGNRLSWNRRLSIAIGSARGLSYLHENANPPIIHRDIKSTNILLDDRMTAKVADFGLSKLAPEGDGKGHVSTQVKGTLGYLDPEYYMTQQLSEKSDVYSFGVVMLELLTARLPIEQGKYVVREIKTALDRDGMTALRPMLDPYLVDYTQHDLKAYLDLALRCVEEGAATRPSMADVARDLEVLLGHSYSESGSISATEKSYDEMYLQSEMQPR